VFMPAIKNGS